MRRPTLTLLPFNKSFASRKTGRSFSSAGGAAIGEKRLSSFDLRRRSAREPLQEPGLLPSCLLGLLVLTSAECAQTTEQDANDDPHHPIIALQELEDA